MTALNPASLHLSRRRKKKEATLLRDTLADIQEAEELFKQLRHGKLLELNASPVHGQVRLMIDNMIAANVLPEDAGAYYNATLSPLDGNRPVRVIGHDPLPEKLLQSKHDLEEKLGMSGSRAIHVLGAAYDLDHPHEKKSGLKIAVPGRIDSVRQMLKYIRRSLEGKKQNPLIIENADGFWNPLLKLSGLMASNSNWVIPDLKQSKLGIHIGNSRERTIELARQFIDQREIKREDYPYRPFLPEGAVIFVASGTAKKVKDLQSAANGFDVTILPIDLLVDFYCSPNETSKTFQGNAEEKAQATVVAWKSMPVFVQKQALKRLGLKPEQCFFLVEDSGIYFEEPDLQDMPQFAHIAHLFPPGSSFPGPETGPAVWGARGVADFVHRSAEAIRQRAEIRGEEPNFNAKNISITVLNPLIADGHGSHPIMMSCGFRDMVLNPDPVHLASHPQNVDLLDYLCPAGTDVPERFVENWADRDGPRAGALHTLLRGGSARLGPATAIIPQPEAYEAALYVPADQVATIREKFSNAGRENVVRVLPYPPIKKLEDVQQLFVKPDAIILGNPPQEGDYAYRFALYGYIFFSRIVADQTRDKFTLGKLAAVMLDDPSPEDRKILQSLLNITDDLHRLGAIPQEPHTLFKQIKDTAQLARDIELAKAETFRYPPFSYAYGPPVLEEKGVPSPKDYHAALLLSASVKEAIFTETIVALLEGLHQRDIGILSGAGLDNGGMGVVTAKAHQLGMYHFGVTAPHIKAHEASDSVENWLRFYRLTPNIYSRMDALSNADISLGLRGGAGTLQEVFAKLLLQEIARMTGDQDMKRHLNDKILLLNERIMIGGNVRGFYDEVLKSTPDELLSRNNAAVPSDVSGALSLIDNHRSAMHAAGRTTSFRL